MKTSRRAIQHKGRRPNFEGRPSKFRGSKKKTRASTQDARNSSKRKCSTRVAQTSMTTRVLLTCSRSFFYEELHTSTKRTQDREDSRNQPKRTMTSCTMQGASDAIHPHENIRHEMSQRRGDQTLQLQRPETVVTCDQQSYQTKRRSTSEQRDTTKWRHVITIELPICSFPILYNLSSQLFVRCEQPTLDAHQEVDQAGFVPGYSNPTGSAEVSDFQKLLGALEQWRMEDFPNVQIPTKLYDKHWATEHTDAKSQQFHFKRAKQGEPLSTHSVEPPIKSGAETSTRSDLLSHDANLRFAEDILPISGTLKLHENVNHHQHPSRT